MIAIIIVIIILIFGILGGIVKIPTNYHGVPIFFGKKINKTLGEGLKYAYPFLNLFGKVLLFSEDLETQSLEGEGSATVISKDGLEIWIEGSSQWRPDPENLFTYSKTPSDTIHHGMKDAIEQGLGEIAGTLEGEAFRARREEIKYIIDCYFSLKRRPDFYINKKDPENFPIDSSISFEEHLSSLKRANAHDAEKLRLIEKIEAKNWIVPTVEKDGRKIIDVLEFYKENINLIVTILKLGNTINEKSEIEERYGIRIETFKLARVRYSEKVQASMEEQKQAENKNKAAGTLRTQKMEIMTEMIAKGVSPDKASDDADALLGIGQKQIISGGALPLINLSNNK